uniref:Uncharacterized protein n=1 Tax=Anguilla anguilla TaxID=7936 RepID=A0A0E9RWW7_ANGAN
MFTTLEVQLGKFTWPVPQKRSIAQLISGSQKSRFLVFIFRPVLQLVFRV